MAKKKRIIVALHCQKCNRFNYTVPLPQKAEYKLDGTSKYCAQCQSHQPHKQRKIPKPS